VGPGPFPRPIPRDFALARIKVSHGVVANPQRAQIDLRDGSGGTDGDGDPALAVERQARFDIVGAERPSCIDPSLQRRQADPA
jgi:hypothetical protein